MNAEMPIQTHTPGEWIIRRSNDGSGDVGITAPELRNVLAECFGALRHGGERAADEAYANARLIAAAPELLEALKEANALILAPAEDLKEGVLSRIRAAIAKAEDRS